MNVYEKRQNVIYDWMARENIALVMMEDFERRRDPGLRWISGQPMDSFVFLSVDRKSLLIPWDKNVAQLYSKTDLMVPYTEFGMNPVKALGAAIDLLKTAPGSKVEIPSFTSYPQFLKFVEALGDFDIICRDNGIGPEIERRRAIKDADELKLYQKISALTSEMTDLLEKNVRSGKIKTETDAALFIETESRKRGCEGSSFEILAAGPARSFGIHAFPAYTAGNFGGEGLSILDYGLKYMGYGSDVTLTFAREPLSKQQEKLISLVEKAYNLAVNMAAPGVKTRDIALAVESLFTKNKKSMPHGLGHGIGLEPHEAPVLNTRETNEWVLEPGMIVTIEPGLYDPVLGGCRLENDVLITENGHEVLTNSRIIRL